MPLFFNFSLHPYNVYSLKQLHNKSASKLYFNERDNLQHEYTHEEVDRIFRVPKKSKYASILWKRTLSKQIYPIFLPIPQNQQELGGNSIEFNQPNFRWVQNPLLGFPRIRHRFDQFSYSPTTNSVASITAQNADAESCNVVYAILFTCLFHTGLA